jgi:hypothetical protein
VRETELAAPVVEHFRELGVVFPEVACWAYGDRADLVVLRDDASLDVIECKTRPTEKLLRQARSWIPYAERVWAAYEPPRRGVPTQHWRVRFAGFGLGVLHVVAGTVTVAVEAATREASSYFHRERLVRSLSPLHELYGEAGNAEGRYLTVFRATCDNLRECVAAVPGLTMKDAVGRISHHYTSDKVARASLLKWVRIGKVDGLEARDEGPGGYRLYATHSHPEGTEP